MYTFVPNKSLGKLLDISPKCFIFYKKFSSEFSYIEVWSIDQISKPLEIEDKIDLTLAIHWCLTYKIRHSTEPRDRIFVKGYGFRSFAENIGKNTDKKLSGKYNEILDQDKKATATHATKVATDALKTVFKRAFQKTAEATGNLISNKDASKIIVNVAGSAPETFSSKAENIKFNIPAETSLEISKKTMHILKKVQQIIDELRLR